MKTALMFAAVSLMPAQLYAQEAEGETSVQSSTTQTQNAIMLSDEVKDFRLEDTITTRGHSVSLTTQRDEEQPSNQYRYRNIDTERLSERFRICGDLGNGSTATFNGRRVKFSMPLTNDNNSIRQPCSG